MGRLSKPILFLLLWLGCISSAFGQRVNPPSNGTPVGGGKILTEYDAKEDATFVRLEPLFLFHDEVPAGQVIKDWLRMGAAFVYKGKKPNLPGDIMLYFASSSGKGCKFPNSLDFVLTFVADSELIKIDSVFSFNEPAVDESCTETVMAKIPRDTFIKILRASKVELRMAETRVELKKSHLESLRNFANRMVP